MLASSVIQGHRRLDVRILNAPVLWSAGERGGQRGGGRHRRGGDRTLHQLKQGGFPGRQTVPAAHQRVDHQRAAVHRSSGEPLQPIGTDCFHIS